MINIVKKINKVVSIITISFVFISFILFLINFKNLPDWVGVHFGPHGEFDVIVHKNDLGFVFYNYIVSFGYLIVFEIVNIFLPKIKTGLNMTEKEDGIFRLIIAIFINFIKIIIVLFYALVWAYSVAYQIHLNTIIGRWFALLLIISILSLIFVINYCSIKYRKIRNSKQ